MATRKCLLLAVFSVLALCHGEEESSYGGCFRLTAAFHVNDDLYIVDGDDYIKMDPKLVEIESGKLSDVFGLPSRGLIEAAFFYPYDGALYFFQGNNYYTYLPESKTSEGPFDVSVWGSFFNGGIDAAGSLGITYLFNGCVFRTSEVGASEEQLYTLGLPCDIDAAWDYDSKLYVSKGDNYWTLDSQGNLDGPIKLHQLFNLKSKAICRESMNPFVARIRAKESYERRHDCRIIDAALNWEGDVYFFSGGKYIGLNDDRREYEISDWGSLPGNIDSAFIYEDDSNLYFMQGPGYYKYNYDRNTHSHIASGPMSLQPWGSFFLDGLDAAGDTNGNSFFFKDCEIAFYKAPAFNTLYKFKTTDVDLPCNVDAIYPKLGNLYIIKGNKVWTWNANDTVTGPQPLSSVAPIRSWKICDTF